MKSDVLYRLFIAKILFQEMPENGLVVDKYTASAGLLIPKKGRQGPTGDESQA